MSVKNLDPIIKTVMTYLITTIKDLVFVWCVWSFNVRIETENKYTLEPQYLCILTASDQCAWPTIKEGRSKDWDRLFVLEGQRVLPKRVSSGNNTEDYWIRCHPEEGWVNNWVPVPEYLSLSLSLSLVLLCWFFFSLFSFFILNYCRHFFNFFKD